MIAKKNWHSENYDHDTRLCILHSTTGLAQFIIIDA